MTGREETPLEMTERHVAESEKRIARQKAIIEAMERDNHPGTAEPCPSDPGINGRDASHSPPARGDCAQAHLRVTWSALRRSRSILLSDAPRASVPRSNCYAFSP